jgi:ferredoxin--NADP+ reductase
MSNFEDIPMTLIGTADMPLRVAIIGSGPSGFYAADHLLKQSDLHIEVDMFDKLPTPFGLVRGGVAPDHPKIKSATKIYDRIAVHPNFRFYGNVAFGSAITYEDITTYYHAVIYAVGAQTDRNLNIDGEDLLGSHAATEFVGWYNGHPEYRDYQFDLSQKSVAIIGVGNVAMDVARILGRSERELYDTDIADYALDALINSNVQDIHIFGRRGPAQAAFTNPEIRELGAMEACDLIIAPEEIELDAYSVAYLQSPDVDKKDVRNVAIMQDLANRPPEGKRKRIHLHFLASPVRIDGNGCVESITLVRNELYQAENGDIRPRATEQYITFPVGLVFRSVGYLGLPLPDVPFYDRWGVIPNEKGRVLRAFGEPETVTGNYVVGWIKRGPSGVIGTNKPDSVETVEMLLEDVRTEAVLNPSAPSRDELEAMLKGRAVRVVTYEDWQRLDQIEQERGQAVGRPRLKFSRIEDMLVALDTAQ